MTALIIAIVTAIIIPIAKYFLDSKIKAKQNEDPAERKQNEDNEAIITHDAGYVNNAIAGKLRNKEVRNNDK